MNQTTPDQKPTLEKATFGAGCFWGVEAAFGQVDGIVGTEVGYMGGALENPTYQDVCTGRSGHAEVVQVRYDPSRISYEQILEIFWACHDPTTLNQQGPDIGTQYRSAVFYHTAQQEAAARASTRSLQTSGSFDAPIVTAIEAAGPFHRAEEYHQKYLQQRGLAHCAIPTSRDPAR